MSRIERARSSVRAAMEAHKELLQSQYKEDLFGTPPATKDGKIIKGTGTLPDMKRIDRILSL